MTATTDRVSAVVAPIAERLGLTVYDVDQPGGTLRVMLDADGGVDLDTLAEATREISRVLDVEQPIAGSYTLEVSSPGLERPLRNPAHWRGALGERVKVKLMPGVEGDRRAEGVVTEAGDRTVTLETPEGGRTIRIEDVSSARTVFEWGAEAGSTKKGPGKKGSAKHDTEPDSGGTDAATAPAAGGGADTTPTTESSEESQ